MEMERSILKVCFIRGSAVAVLNHLSLLEFTKVIFCYQLYCVYEADNYLDDARPMNQNS
jgi:hypothetical protein